VSRSTALSCSRRWELLRGRRDRGSLMLILIPLMSAMMLFAGLVLDGGAALAAREHAANVAREAARAGADALTPTSLRTAEPGQLALDPAAATQAAQSVLADAGLTGTVTVSGATVTVTATASHRTAMLTLVGISSLSETMTASAIPLPQAG
jgi:Flp pilus assembly protein TadG